MPFQMHNFLSMITLGKLPIPAEFLIEFEKTKLAHVIGLDRKLKLPHEIADIKNNPAMLEDEIELRKKHITMLIAIFVVVKVFVVEVFNSNNKAKNLFANLPKTELVYFNFYGMTLVALLTDIIYSRFTLNLTDMNPDKSEISIKHLLFDSLLEPLDEKLRQSQFNYSTFRYGKERQKRWNEMEDYFKKMLG